MADPLPEWLTQALRAVRQERVVQLARVLIDAHSPTGSELPAANALAAALSRHGLPATIDEFAPGRANLITSVAGTAVNRAGHQPHLMLVGHLDTTGFGDDRDRAWLHELSPADRPLAHVEDGILSGLGAFNMKGGVAAAAEALLALAEIGAQLPGTVSLAALAGESEKAEVRGLARDYEGPSYAGGGVGAERLMVVGPRPDGVVICEPSGLAVINAQPGYVSLGLRILGRSGYLPAAGAPTVLTVLADVMRTVADWGAVWERTAEVDTGLGLIRPTTTIGAVDGGGPFKPSGTPSAAAMYVDLRVPAGSDADAAVADLVAACRKTAARHGPFEVEELVYARNLPGAVIPAEHPLVLAARAARDAVGGPPEPAPDWAFVPGDDGKVFAQVGIPYVKTGPASPVDRDPRFGREQVRIAELEQAARLYVELAARDLGPTL